MQNKIDIEISVLLCLKLNYKSLSYCEFVWRSERGRCWVGCGSESRNIHPCHFLILHILSHCLTGQRFDTIRLSVKASGGE